MAIPVPSVGTWELDGVVFDGTDDVNGFAYVVQTVKGWPGSSSRRPDQAPRPNGNGSYRGPNYRGSRVIGLTGLAQTRSRAARDQLSDSLAGLCRAATPLFPLVRHENTRSLQCFVELNDTIDVTELPDGFTVTFDIQLIANDPRKFSTQLKHDETTLAQDPADGILWDGTGGGTGTEWQGPATAPNTGLVYQATAGAPGQLVMENDGTDDAPIIFTIRGPSTGTLPNPSLMEVGTGNTITYGGVLVPGDELTIDTGTGLVRLNGAAGAGQLSRADLFEIGPRSTSVVLFSAGGPAPGAIAEADWRDSY